MKAADRIPGLRPKAAKVRGAPPPWADWVHKFGPVLTVLASAAIFYFTFRYTVEPVYRRAVLEEANSRLQLDLTTADKKLAKTVEETERTAQALLAQRREVDDARKQLSTYADQLARARMLVEVANDGRITAERRRLDAENARSAAQTDLSRVQVELGSRSELLSSVSRQLNAASAELVQTIVRQTIDESVRASSCWRALYNSVAVDLVRADANDHPIAGYDRCVSSTFAREPDTRRPPISEAVVAELRPIMLQIDAKYAAKYGQVRTNVLAVVAEAKLLSKKFDDIERDSPNTDSNKRQQQIMARYHAIGELRNRLYAETTRAQEIWDSAHAEFKGAAEKWLSAQNTEHGALGRNACGSAERGCTPAHPLDSLR